MTHQLTYLLDEDMALLEAKGDVVKYAPEQTIINERTNNDKVFWVRRGAVRIQLSRLYQDTVIAGIGPGEMFGEITFLTEDSASATVVAHSETETLEIKRDELEQLLAENDGLAARFYRTAATTLARRLKIQDQRS